MRKYFLRLKKDFRDKKFKVIFPTLFTLGMLLSIFLFFLSVLVSGLVACAANFGCVSLGIFLGLLVNLPGYLVAGKLLSSFSIHWLVSLFLVIALSLAFYYLLGALADKLKSKTKLTGPTKLVIYIFLGLLGVFLTLSLFA